MDWHGSGGEHSYILFKSRSFDFNITKTLSQFEEKTFLKIITYKK